MQLGLTPDQLAARSKWIGASEAQRLMNGDLRSLWREKTGRSKSKQIMSDWERALKASREALYLDWFEHKTGLHIIRRGESVQSKEYPFMGCTLDGVIEETGEPVDCKHLSAWTKGDPLQWAVDHYTWQMIHQPLVLGADRGSLLVGHGDKEPVLQPVEMDPFAAEELIAACRTLWGYVERDEEPEGDGPSWDAPAVEIKTLRTVVIDGGEADANGVWTGPQDGKFQPWPNYGSDFAQHLATVIRTQPAATANAIAREAIKVLVPEDVGEIRRGAVTVKRDKRNAIHFSLPKGE